MELEGFFWLFPTCFSPPQTVWMPWRYQQAVCRSTFTHGAAGEERWRGRIGMVGLEGGTICYFSDMAFLKSASSFPHIRQLRDELLRRKDTGPRRPRQGHTRSLDDEASALRFGQMRFLLAPLHPRFSVGEKNRAVGLQKSCSGETKKRSLLNQHSASTRGTRPQPRC